MIVKMPVTFEEWLATPTQNGNTYEDEIRWLYIAIEKKIETFKYQFNRRELFLDIAYQIYECSELYR